MARYSSDPSKQKEWGPLMSRYSSKLSTTTTKWKSTQPEKLKPVNRQARRAIKSGRKKNEQRPS